jgi:hypothetical protein
MMIYSYRFQINVLAQIKEICPKGVPWDLYVAVPKVSRKEKRAERSRQGPGKQYAKPKPQINPE